MTPRPSSTRVRMARAKPKSGTKRVWFSPTGISTLERCPRCFWLQYHERIRQPEGIVSRLANRFDEVLKQYFNLYRGTDKLPPLIAGECVGTLESPFQEKYWYEHGERFGYFGKLDECLIAPDGRATPFDHKTTSSDPALKGIFPAYQFQLDSYAFLLEKAGKPTTGEGFLMFVYPETAATLHDRFPMRIMLQRLATDPARAFGRFLEAIAVFDAPIPKASPNCPFCLWYASVKPFFEKGTPRTQKRTRPPMTSQGSLFTE